MALRLLPEIPHEAKVFLETQLGRSLALHPLQAQKVFREFAGTPQIDELARVYSRGLSQIAQMRAEFVRHVLPTLDEETASLIWYHLICAKAWTPKIISTLADWMNKHYGKRCYLLVRDALKERPDAWKCLLPTRKGPARHRDLPRDAHRTT